MVLKGFVQLGFQNTTRLKSSGCIYREVDTIQCNTITVNTLVKTPMWKHDKVRKFIFSERFAKLGLDLDLELDCF